MKQVRITALLLLVSAFAHADRIIIPWFSQWKVLDNGSNQGTVWTAPSFNDITWRSAYAQLGYGDDDESTVINYGTNAASKYVTTYFRRKVDIPNPSQYNSFTFDLRRDDGVVVYVNGVEVLRDNMPASPTVISNTTYANSEVADDGNTPQSFTIPVSAFSSGINTIAVEVHQGTASSSDLSFDLRLTGVEAGSPVLTRGPYLMVATTSSIKVRWRSDIAGNSVVRYGTSPSSLTGTATDNTATTEHIVQINGLSPNTKYYYSIGSGNYTMVGNEDLYFYTAPATPKPTRIWATGDFGNGSNNSSTVRNAYLNYTGSTPTDAWIWLGDNAYSSGQDQEYSDKVFNYRYERMFRSTCVWPAPGNHDYANVGYHGFSSLGTGFPYFNIFSPPQAGEAGGVASGTPKYYSYNYSNIHFISLDSYGSFNSPGSPMYTWLQNDLANNTQKWIIVYFHHAPYTKGSHDSDTESELVDMRTNIVPLLESYHVDLVLSGHSHSYERSYFINNHYGVESTFSAANQVDGGSGAPTTPYFKSGSNGNIGTVYAVVGCSGQSVGGTHSGYPHDAMYTSTVSTYGSMVIDVNGDTLTAKMLTNNVATPVLYDQFRIIKGCHSQGTLAPFQPVYVTDAPFTLTGGQPAGGTYSGTGVYNNEFDPATAGIGTHTITYSVVDSNGCYSEASATIDVVDAYLTLNLKVFIEGFYRGNGTMTELIGPGSTDMIDVWLVPSDTNDQNVFPSGGQLSNTGEGQFLYSGVPMGGSYYVVVYHRNSLETWSSTPLVVNNDTLSYDFTTAATKAYGSRLKAIGNGNYGIYSGDVDQDGDIDSLDQSQLSSAVINFLTGYTVWDITGDNVIEAADFSLVENNAFLPTRRMRPPGR